MPEITEEEQIKRLWQCSLFFMQQEQNSIDILSGLSYYYIMVMHKTEEKKWRI